MTKLYDRRNLDPEDAIAICLDDRMQAEIAEDYGISRPQVSLIQSGKRYANVTLHVRDKKAFAIKLSDLRFKHQDLMAQAERVAKEINELEALQRSHPDEIKKQADLDAYRQLRNKL